jgi:hypothetical protein
MPYTFVLRNTIVIILLFRIQQLHQWFNGNNMLALSVVDPGVKPRLGQTEDYNISIWHVSAKHTTLRNENTVF